MVIILLMILCTLIVYLIDITTGHTIGTFIGKTRGTKVNTSVTLIVNNYGSTNSYTIGTTNGSKGSTNRTIVNTFCEVLFLYV